MAEDFLRQAQDLAREKGIKGVQKDAQNFFRKQVRELRSGVTAGQLLKNNPDRLVGKGNLALGKMYLFFYDAKWKEQLPYWDRVPLIFVVNRNNTTEAGNKGFMGLNLHYLSVKRRVALLAKLAGTTNNKRFDESTRLQKIAYKDLKEASQLKAFRPCLKQYLNTQVRSRFLLVPGDLWLPMAFLPVANFEKASKQKVWFDSRQMIKG